MTTIVLSQRVQRNNGMYQVFGFYAGPDDRYVFGVREFATLPEAERQAAWMMHKFQADHFERTAP
jgi:hypothetical protein